MIINIVDELKELENNKLSWKHIKNRKERKMIFWCPLETIHTNYSLTRSCAVAVCLSSGCTHGKGWSGVQLKLASRNMASVPRVVMMTKSQRKRRSKTTAMYCQSSVIYTGTHQTQKQWDMFISLTQEDVYCQFMNNHEDQGQTERKSLR